MSSDVFQIFVPGDPPPTKNHVHISGTARGLFPVVSKDARVRGWQANVFNHVSKCTPTAAELTEYGCFLWLEFRLKAPRPDQFGDAVISKPDDENLVKPTKDALTKAGWWSDDCKVFGSHTLKVYQLQGQQTGVWIRIESKAFYFSYAARIFPQFEDK
jgi:Holliday junction resolvase RusA-like endonuclease